MKNPHQKGILTDFLDRLSIPRAGIGRITATTAAHGGR